jgi:hypothetical protein
MWRMQINEFAKMLHERTYYSAHECTIAMAKAQEYYRAKGMKVLIEMFDKNGYLIASLNTND